MTTAAALAFAGAAIFAGLDWWAVTRASKRLEYLAKPATLAALVMAAVVLDPAHPGMRGWFVAALVLSLAGDVFLMLPGDRFVAGLASFLLGHLAYVVGFLVAGDSWAESVAGVVIVGPVTLVVGGRILAALRHRGDRDLVGPVAAYMAAISTMVVLAVGDPWAMTGAILFYVSDALIAWNRFVQPYPWAGLAIIVTYHLGQAALVASLL